MLILNLKIENYKIFNTYKLIRGILMNNLPEKFDEFNEARRNGFITIKN